MLQNEGEAALEGVMFERLLDIVYNGQLEDEAEEAPPAANPFHGDVLKGMLTKVAGEIDEDCVPERSPVPKSAQKGWRKR